MHFSVANADGGSAEVECRFCKENLIAFLFRMQMAAARKAAVAGEQAERLEAEAEALRKQVSEFKGELETSDRQVQRLKFASKSSISV